MSYPRAGGKVLRANTETPLAARAGDILFSGDALRAIGAPASFLYCPGKSSQTLDSGGEVLLDTKQLKVKSGKLDPPKPVNACFLPQLVRVAVASQQHYGVSMTRGLAKPEGDVVAFNALPAAVQTAIAPFEQALRANPADVPSLVEEATVFEQNKLEANALAAYRKVADEWKDAVWVRGRIFELEESLATQAALKAAEISPDAKTYGLMIGISKYQKLPQDLWLQFADADAKTFSQHLASARGGGIPADQMVVLTNEEATTAALRNAFQTFLRNRAGKKDTVFILIAGHGIVDNRGAYILTYDSDPQDLSATAIPYERDPVSGRRRAFEGRPRGSDGRCGPRREHRQSQERGDRQRGGETWRSARRNAGTDGRPSARGFRGRHAIRRRPRGLYLFAASRVCRGSLTTTTIVSSVRANSSTTFATAFRN